MPSPACIGRVGETIKGHVKIDKNGDNIQASALPGDHWRTRHDRILHLLHRMCQWAGTTAELEVFNLFSGQLRQEGLNRLQCHQQRQGLVPDMRVMVPPMPDQVREVEDDQEGEGPQRRGRWRRVHQRGEEQRGGTPAPGRQTTNQPRESLVMHELKVISSNKTRYKPGWEERAVDRRAETLPQEYLEKARAADRKFNGVLPGEVGGVEQKLIDLGEVRGIVAGNFGEVSEATHLLLAHLATCRVRVAGVTRGRRGVLRSEEAERSIAISSLRRRLGVATVRAQAYSLHGRLDVLGPGTAAAAGRRRYAADVERRWRQEELANALSRRYGRSFWRSGFARS